MLSRIKSKLKNFYIKKWKLDKNQNEHIISNINMDIADKNQKKVLICYLDYIESSKVLYQAEKSKVAVHTCRYELFQIIRTFIKFNFSIDVCYCNNELLDLIDINKYDLVFGFGMVYRLFFQKDNKAKKILYLTENPFEISYAKEKERIKYLFERHQIIEKTQRTGIFYKKGDELQSDMIISMAKPEYLDCSRVPIKYFPPSACMADSAPDYSKRLSQSFMVFGTTGFIHKGVDILIDIFINHPEWRLYICGGGVETYIKRIGLAELPRNIIDCGYISVQDEYFLEISNECSFILSASCSESTSTGILTGMCRGMIPIIMKGSGLDNLTNYLEFFDDYHIESVEKKISEVVNMKKEYMFDRFVNIYNFSNEQYSIKQFGVRLDEIIGAFINEQKW